MTLADRERSVRERRKAFVMGAKMVGKYALRSALKDVEHPLDRWLLALESWVGAGLDVEMPKLPEDMRMPKLPVGPMPEKT